MRLNCLYNIYTCIYQCIYYVDVRVHVRIYYFVWHEVSITLKKLKLDIPLEIGKLQ